MGTLAPFLFFSHSFSMPHRRYTGCRWASTATERSGIAGQGKRVVALSWHLLSAHTRWEHRRLANKPEVMASARRQHLHDPFFFSSLGLLSSAWDLAKHRQPASNVTVSPLSGAWTHRWVEAPPLSGLMVGLYPHVPSRIEDRRWFFYPQHHLSKMRRPRQAQACQWRLASSHMATQSTPVTTTHGWWRPGDILILNLHRRAARPRVLPARHAEPWPAVVHEVKIRASTFQPILLWAQIESPPSTILTRLNLRSRPALDTNVALNRLLGARSRGTICEHGFVVDLEPRSWWMEGESHIVGLADVLGPLSTPA
jgi:hypothetical protein